MVACHLPGENRQFMFHRNLAEEIADAEGHRPNEDRLPVLRDPDEVGFETLGGVLDSGIRPE